MTAVASLTPVPEDIVPAVDRGGGIVSMLPFPSPRLACALMRPLLTTWAAANAARKSSWSTALHSPSSVLISFSLERDTGIVEGKVRVLVEGGSKGWFGFLALPSELVVTSTRLLSGTSLPWENIWKNKQESQWVFNPDKSNLHSIIDNSNDFPKYSSPSCIFKIKEKMLIDF